MNCEICSKSKVCKLIDEYNGMSDKSCSFFLDANSVIEVVRCSECIRYKNEICELHCVSINDDKDTVIIFKNPDDYCNYGERKVRRKIDGEIVGNTHNCT